MLAAAGRREENELARASLLLDGMAMYTAFGGAKIKFGEHFRRLTGSGPATVTAKQKSDLRALTLAHEAAKAARGEGATA